MLKVGTPAPDFEATLDDGSSFRLSDLRADKNVVLYFYPKSFSGGCTAQACSFRDNYDSISAYDAVIVGVSADAVDSQAAFKTRYELGFPLVADEDKRVSNLYGTIGSFGIRARVTYIIDKQGVIRSAFRHDIAIGRHQEDVITALKGIQGERLCQ